MNARKTMQEASEQAARLHALTDELNAKLAEAEAAIVALKFGVTARVPMKAEESGPAFLTFVKSGGAWGLFYEQGDQLTPLVNATRAQRLRAIPFLEPLVRELARSIEIEISTVVQATQHVESLTKLIREGGS